MTDKPTLEVVESIEVDDQQPEQPEVPQPSYHTLLEVWRAVLEPARDGSMDDETISPQWATKIVSTYQGLTYQDTPAVHRGVFTMADEMGTILDEIIDSDPNCLKRTEPDLDATENAQHYLDLITKWQVYMLLQELAWDPSAPDAAVQIAIMSEVHQMFLGPNGLVNHLDQIKFQFTEENQQQVADELIAAKVDFLENREARA